MKITQTSLDAPERLHSHERNDTSSTARRRSATMLPPSRITVYNSCCRGADTVYRGAHPGYAERYIAK